MSIEDFLVQSCDVLCEAPPGGVPPQDALGGADRTNYLTVASGVPCLVRPMSAAKMAYSGGGRDDARRNVVTARIYFSSDPAPEGLSSRHRIVVEGQTYAVTGVINPNSMGRIYQVDCEMIRG